MGFLRGLFGGTAEDALDEALARPRETAAPRGLLYGKGSLSSMESSEEKESDRCSRSDIGGRKDGTSPWKGRKELRLFQNSQKYTGCSGGCIPINYVNTKTG